MNSKINKLVSRIKCLLGYHQYTYRPGSDSSNDIDIDVIPTEADAWQSLPMLNCKQCHKIWGFAGDEGWCDITLYIQSRVMKIPFDLEENWDSYGGHPITQDVINAVTDFWIHIPYNLTPQVVPTTKGGLQLEWHLKGTDIEIEFYPLKNEVIICSGPLNIDLETTIEQDKDLILEVLQKLSQEKT